MPRRPAVTAALVAAVVGVSACASPAIDDYGYRGKVGHSAAALVGTLGSARLAAQLDLQGRMLGPLTDTVVTDAENDAGSVVSSFESVQPPDEASILLRSHADDVFTQASGAVSDLRIATRRGDEPAMRHAIGELSDSIAALQKLQDQL